MGVHGAGRRSRPESVGGDSFCSKCREILARVPHDTKKGSWIWVCSRCGKELGNHENPFLNEIEI